MRGWLFLLYSLSHGLNAEPIRVVTEYFAPYQTINAQGEFAGVSTRLVQQILTKAEQPYQLEYMPWPRAYRLAKDTPNVLIYSLLQTDERFEDFVWLAPLCPLTVSFYRLKSRPDVSPKSVADATRYIVGIEQGQANYALMLRNGFRQDVNLQLVSHANQLPGMTERQRIDLMLMADASIAQLPQPLQQQFESALPVQELQRMMFLATSRLSDPSFIKQMQQAAAHIMAQPQPNCDPSQR